MNSLFRRKKVFLEAEKTFFFIEINVIDPESLFIDFFKINCLINKKKNSFKNWNLSISEILTFVASFF